jgi:hypothetical protein
MAVLLSAANCAVAIAASIALVATTGHAAEVSKSENIGPWEIDAIYKGDQFDRCSINRSLQDDIVARFVRTSDGLTLELESPNWTLERGKNYPVKMTMATLSLDTEVAAEPQSVSMTIDDKKFESALRDASALNIIAAGATIRVPLDKSTVAFNELARCVEKNATTVAANVFCGSATSAVVAGVREGKSAECQQDAGMSAETKAIEDSEPAEDIKPLMPVKSRKLRSRPLPPFLANLFNSQRQ